MNKRQRKCLVEKWNQEWLQPHLDRLESTMESLRKNAEATRRLRMENELRVIQNSTIIGCTTVGAAKY